MHEARVMHLIFKSSLQEQHCPLSESYFIVCWSNECLGYFKGGKFSSADESDINCQKTKSILYAQITNELRSQDFSLLVFFARNLWSRKCGYKEFGCIWEYFFFILRAGVGSCQRFLNFFVHCLQYLSFGIDFEKYFLLLKSSYETIFWFLYSNHVIFSWRSIYVRYNFFNGVFFASNNFSCNFWNFSRASEIHRLRFSLCYNRSAWFHLLLYDGLNPKEMVLFWLLHCIVCLNISEIHILK